MASTLDLQEQEQLDQLKAFWQRWGNLITWLVTLVLLAFAAWNGWNWWQREQAAKASALHAELERAARAAELPRVKTAWEDLKSRHPGTVQAQQGALWAAQALSEAGELDAAKAALAWAAEKAELPEYRAIARLRWAAVLLEQKQAEEALKVLEPARGAGFDALLDDRKGDAHLALSQPEPARAAFEAALKGLPEELEYRRVVQAKLMSLGTDPSTIKPAAAAGKP